MPPRSTQLLAKSYAAGGFHTAQYTAPTGYVTLLKDLQVSSVYGSPQQVQVILNTFGGDNVYLLLNDSLAPNHIERPGLWAVLNAGDQLSVYSDHGNIDVLASGAELLIT